MRSAPQKMSQPTIGLGNRYCTTDMFIVLCDITAYNILHMCQTPDTVKQQRIVHIQNILETYPEKINSCLKSSQLNKFLLSCTKKQQRQQRQLFFSALNVIKYRWTSCDSFPSSIFLFFFYNFGVEILCFNRFKSIYEFEKLKTDRLTNIRNECGTNPICWSCFY